MGTVKFFIAFALGVLIAVGGLLALSADSDSTGEARVIARNLGDGAVEVGLQQRSGDGWGERLLPSARFLTAEAEVGRWRSSSAVMLELPAPANALGENYTHCLITHEHPGDEAFWNPMRGAALRHEERYNATVHYRHHHDSAAQAQLISDCVADGVDGIVTTLADPDALRGAIAEATAAGIPVVTINSGVNDFVGVGAVRHISIDEELAGERSGERLHQAGVTGAVLCVIHEAANIGLEERCNGLERGYDGAVERLSVAAAGVADLDAVSVMIAERLSAGGVGAVMALNTQIGLAAVQSVETAGSEAVVVTFDQNHDVLQAIADGEILFAVDTSPFNQAYYGLSSLPTVIGSWAFFLAAGVEDPKVISGQFALKLSPRWFTRSNAIEWIKVNDAMAEYSAGRSGG